MLVGRLNKEPTDTSRFTVDFTPWVDTGETITAFTTPVITDVTNSFPAPFSLYPAPPVYPPFVDPSPLLVSSSYLLTGLQVQMLVIDGSIGRVYQVQFVATGSSGRLKTIEVLVNVVGPNSATIF